MKERLSKNNIDILYDDTWKKLTTTEDIQGEVNTFYKNLIGTIVTGIDVSIVRKGKQLSASSAEY